MLFSFEVLLLGIVPEIRDSLLASHGHTYFSTRELTPRHAGLL